MKSLLLVVLLGLSGAAYAEHGCQAGFIPVNQGNGQTCVADYNLPHWKNQSQPVTPSVTWADRWGAIASNGKTGNVGTIAGQQNKKKAKKIALERCGDGCKIDMVYYNQCAAIAWGTGSYSVNGAATIDEASTKAMSVCGQGANDCKVVFTECSMAERIR